MMTKNKVPGWYLRSCATGLFSLFLALFFCLLCDLLSCFFLNMTNWNHKHTALIICLFASYLCIAITRLEGCTPLLWPQLLLLPALLTVRWSWRSEKKTNCSCYCFCAYSIFLVIHYIVKLLHNMMIDWLNKTIQTTSC